MSKTQTEVLCLLLVKGVSDVSSKWRKKYKGMA